MGSRYFIEQPQLICTLPEPFDRSAGSLKISPVHTFHAGRKRKRPQVVVGSDGNGLHVFNIQTSQVITAHSIPPLSNLAAPPLCVVSKATRHASGNRFTYAAIEFADRSSAPSLICFQETLESSANAAKQVSSSPVKTSFAFGDNIDPVVHIDAACLVRGTTKEHNVIAIQKSGKITALSADLERTLWSSIQPATAFPDSRSVNYITLMDCQSAFSGFLGDRIDVISAIGPPEERSSTAFQQTSLMLVVYAPVLHEPTQSEMKAALFALRSPSIIANSDSAVQYLTSWSISVAFSPGRHDLQPQNIFFDPSSGYLQYLTGGSLIVHDLSGVLPKTISKSPTSTSISQFLPLSKSRSLILTGERCAIYDTIYHSTYASQALSSHALPLQGSKKRRSESYLPQQSSLVQFFPKIGSVVLLFGESLLSIQLGIPRTKGKLSSANGSRLIDALGRGEAPVASDDSKDWVDTKTMLNDAASRKAVKEFETIFLQSLQKLEKKHPKSSQKLKSLADLQRDHLLYALGKIFVRNSRYQSPGDGRAVQHSSISIGFMVPAIFKRFAGDGGMTADNIQTALRRTEQNNSLPEVQVRPQDLVLSIAAFDRSLILLSDIVSSTELHLPLSGVMSALKLLIGSFDNETTLRPQRLLKATALGESSKTEEQQLQIEAEAASRDLDVATSILESGVALRGSAIEKCLEQLAIASPSVDVIQSMRQIMNRGEILWLLELLRHEMMQGGWTVRMLDFYSANNAPDGPANAVFTLCSLLNCAIDALGTGAWLGDLSADDGELSDRTGALISYLRNDTSAVLEGVQESSFIEGFLKDFLRYEEQVAETESLKEHTIGKIKTIPTPAHIDGQRILPLGINSAEGISRTKVGAGGEIQKRTNRDRAYLMSKRIPVYSFEQIRV